MKGPVDFPEDAYVMMQEPLKDVTPEKIKAWLNSHTNESDLALALAQVSNKTGWLGHDLDEFSEQDYPAAKKIFDEWCALEEELYSSVITILETENREKGTKHITSGIGLHYIVLPFMEHNGFQDGSGWWIKKQ